MKKDEKEVTINTKSTPEATKTTMIEIPEENAKYIIVKEEYAYS